MLNVSGVWRSFGSHSVLKDVHFTLRDPGLTGLIGPGGSGKSTLLKVLAGLYPPDRGTVAISEHLTAAEGEIGGVSLMFQEGALFDSFTVYENVAFPLVGGKIPTTALDMEVQERVNSEVSAILARVGLTRAAWKYPAQLSGGMRKRAALARAIVARPPVVLLDDPTAGLDPVASSVIMDLIVELSREYRPYTIIASHDLRRLLPIVDDVIAIFDGHVVFQGSLEELRELDSPAIKNFVSCRFDLS